MRIMLILIAVAFMVIVGFNVNGCTSDDAQPVLQQVQDTTVQVDTTADATTADATTATEE